jgi:hypothetical protein
MSSPCIELNQGENPSLILSPAEKGSEDKLFRQREKVKRVVKATLTFRVTLNFQSTNKHSI